MRITIRGKNLELTEEIKDYINEKIGVLERSSEKIDSSSIADVEVGVSNMHHKSGKIYTAIVNITIPKNFIRAESEAEDLYQAIDQVKAKLESELNSHKKGFISKKHRAALIWKKVKAISPMAWLKNEFRKGKREKEKF